MRVAIREQLTALVILAVLVGLAIVSIPTWIYVYNFVVDVESDGLALTASLKASRLASEIDLLDTLCQTISTRVLLQQSIVNFYNRNATNPFANAITDLQFAMSTSEVTGLLQARLYSRNTTGDSAGLLNATGSGVGKQFNNILLPYLTPNGSLVYLSDTDDGYPPALYPNVTYKSLGYANPYEPSTPAVGVYAFPETNVKISDNGGMVLGPLMINETFALISLTTPIRSLNNTGFIIGYMTIVASAASLINVQTSREGLVSSGMALVVGPAHPSNQFNVSLGPSNGTYSPPKDAFGASEARFVLPPLGIDGQAQRHATRAFANGDYGSPFALTKYPSLVDVYYKNNSQPNNSTAILSTTNEQGIRVAVGVARPQNILVDWAVVVEMAEGEAYGPIDTLRKILLGCVFGTAGVMVLLVVPCVHLSIMPIRRLKYATEKSIAPPGYEDYEDFKTEDPSSSGTNSAGSRKGIFASIRRKIKKRKKAMTQQAEVQAEVDSHRRIFKIPGRVKDRKHFVTDELTELTQTFNEMTDELLEQYTSLDEKVADRTRELETSKRTAEAANKSKTLFIANISHELKTPLNGIMGMCAVCAEEDDIVQIRHLLKTLYRSGDLLLHLLEDLLSFSKNQIGEQLSLEGRNFRLGDVRSQILSIFDKQVREGKITFNVAFLGSDMEYTELGAGPDRRSLDQGLPALGPAGMGHLKHAYIWGDQHRILQVIINLVSNSLKFTPEGGRVELRIRCLGEIEDGSDESRDSSPSKNGSSRVGRSRHRHGSSSAHSAGSRAMDATDKPHQGGMALSMNPMGPKAAHHVHVRERSPTPPPPNAKQYMFEFEVEDTGRGIHEHMQEKIFEPFVQGDLGLSKKYGGTGLGLSICSQLAKLMGGSIGIKSTLGVGSTFTMQIPLRYVKDRVPSTAPSSAKSRSPSVASAGRSTHRNSLGSVIAASPEQQGGSNTTPSVMEDKQPRLIGLSAPFFASNPHPAPPNKKDRKAAIDKAIANKTGQGRLRVLVADDNSTNIEVMGRMLKLEDVYDVAIAKDGQEAYELVKADMEKNQCFDVILMDIQMPNLDGLQSTRLIRKMGYMAPIVALTAFSEESNVRECMESGMDEFLSKPIRRPALKKVLNKFATIPEESETGSLSGKGTMEKLASAVHVSSQETEGGKS